MKKVLSILVCFALLFCAAPVFAEDAPAGEEYVFCYERMFVELAADRAAGSSRVDPAVHAEAARGRRVYLDYTKEPQGFRPALLSGEARDYLSACGADHSVVKRKPSSAVIGKTCDESLDPVVIRLSENGEQTVT